MRTLIAVLLLLAGCATSKPKACKWDTTKFDECPFDGPSKDGK